MAEKLPADSRRSLTSRSTPSAAIKKCAAAWALCATVVALAAAFASATGNAQGAAPGRGPAAPQPTLAIDASKLDSSKTKDLPLVFTEENTAAKLPAPTMPTLENATILKPFPDPFAWANDPLGKTRSTDFKDWPKHRAEMLAMFQHYEVGTKPVVDIATQVTAEFTPNPPPASAPATAAASEPALVPVGAPGGGFGRGPGRGRGPTGPGGTLVVKVTANGQTLTLTCPISIPVGAKAPYPVIIGMNSGTGSLPGNDFTTRGIAAVTFRHDDVTKYQGGSQNDPFFKLYPDQIYSSQQTKGNTGQYAAWAWGVSRIIDGFSLVKDKFPVDMNHIAVTGCSYAGKMALFAGAFDERIALTVAQESGGGGATNWRFSNTEPNDAQGKLSVESIGNTDHKWFASQMFGWAGDNLPELPEDHHMLTALVAPRALYVTGNTDYLWLSNRSMYVNSKATSKVYSTLGIADRFGYVVNGGHGHCQFPASQEPDLAYFLDRFMKDQKDLSKIIATVPAAFASVDPDRWTNWWGTGKADLPDAK